MCLMNSRGAGGGCLVYTTAFSFHMHTPEVLQRHLATTAKAPINRHGFILQKHPLWLGFRVLGPKAPSKPYLKTPLTRKP